MRTVRHLLVSGNDKLSAGVFHFDLPAVRTCPGKTPLCRSHCYATTGRFRYPQVQERLAWNLRQALRKDFVDRLAAELYRKGVLLMRWHVAGDFFSPDYARKALAVVDRSEHCTFWAYTRSWRVPAVFEVLKELAVRPNMTLWLSADADTGPPPVVPRGCKVAWMQTTEGEDTCGADLVFRIRPLRRLPLPIALPVCPTDTPEGKERGVSCATCQTCWRC